MELHFVTKAPVLDRKVKEKANKIGAWFNV